MFSTKLLNKCYFGITNYIVIYVLLGRVFERLKKWDIDFNIYFNNYIDLIVGKQTWRRVSNEILKVIQYLKKVNVKK